MIGRRFVRESRFLDRVAAHRRRLGTLIARLQIQEQAGGRPGFAVDKVRIRTARTFDGRSRARPDFQRAELTSTFKLRSALPRSSKPHAGSHPASLTTIR